ncbi:hypothetical protein RFI_07503, partial [Reticulomyxa filosa]
PANKKGGAIAKQVTTSDNDKTKKVQKKSTNKVEEVVTPPSFVSHGDSTDRSIVSPEAKRQQSSREPVLSDSPNVDLSSPITTTSNENKEDINTSSNANANVNVDAIKINQPRSSVTNRVQHYRLGVQETEQKARARASSHAYERRKDDVDIDDETKQKASYLLSEYAKRQSSVAREKRTLDVSFHVDNFGKENALDILKTINVLHFVKVHKVASERWRLRHTYANESLTSNTSPKQGDEEDAVSGSGSSPHDSKNNTEDTVEMGVLVLQGNAIIRNLTEEQRQQFKQLILWGIELIPYLYRLDFSQSEITNSFFGDISDALAQRFKKIVEKPVIYDAQMHQFDKKLTLLGK